MRGVSVVLEADPAIGVEAGAKATDGSAAAADTESVAVTVVQ